MAFLRRKAIKKIIIDKPHETARQIPTVSNAQKVTDVKKLCKRSIFSHTQNQVEKTVLLCIATTVLDEKKQRCERETDSCAEQVLSLCSADLLQALSWLILNWANVCSRT